MPELRPRPVLRTLAVGLVAALALGACESGSGDGKGTGTTASTTAAQKAAAEAQRRARTTKWNEVNAARTKFTKAANQTAREVADRLAAAGVPCAAYADTAFGPVAGSYGKQGLPIPTGSGECDGGPDGEENLLIEVYAAGKRPNAADLVAAKRKLLCRRAKELGRQPGGVNLFPGIPYVINAEKTWVVQPDTFETNQQIAAALGLESRDMCEGIE